MSERIAPPWALILAGGDGTRLRSLTSQIVGDDRPKQFCALLDGETLLERTCRRANLVARFDHQAIAVTAPHAPYYRPLVHDLPPGRLVVQPENRGTAPAILYSLLHVTQLAGDVPLAILPSDHYVSDDLAFMGYVRSAVDVVRRRPDLVVLLGLEPTRPEVEYGWIGPAETPLAIDGEPVFPVRRFWEKPNVSLAECLYQGGCLWNSFVMVGWTNTFFELIALARPSLVVPFAALRSAVGTTREPRAVERVYRRLPPQTDFSGAILAASTARLGVMRVKGVGWSDWGNPQRVLASLVHAGLRPHWIDRVRLAEAS
jgi:mannose-1-phosphate guanylyltransferase